MASISSFPSSSFGSLEEVSSSSYGDRVLTEVLKNPEHLEKFRAFLAANLCEENLLFYLEVEEFKKKQWNSTEEMHEEIKRIVLKYLVDGAPSQVNVTCEIRTELSNKIDTDTSLASSIPLDVHIFDELQDSVWELMNCDSIPKFVSSHRKSSVADFQETNSSTACNSPKLDTNSKKLKRTPSFTRKMGDISKLSAGQKRVAMAKKEKLEHFFGVQISPNSLLSNQAIESPASSPSLNRRPLRRTPSVEIQSTSSSSASTKRRTTKKLENFFGESFKNNS